MFRTIVVGCDGSEHAADALAFAQQLRHPEGRLLLAAVHDRYGPLPDRRGGYNYGRFIAEQAADAIEQLASTLPEDVPVERHVIADDSVPAAIDGLASREDADLIVLGSTHRTKLGKLTGRTTVQRLLQGAPCAVAVAAPDQADRLAGRPRVCVAHDGSPESDQAVELAYELAKDLSGSVLLVRVIEPIAYAGGYVPVAADYDVEREMGAFANSSLAEVAERAPDGVAVERRTVHGGPVQMLLEIARADADLLVAGSRHYGPVHRVFAGSVSAPLLTNGRLPVLVTPRTTAAGEQAEPAEAEAVS